MFLGIISGSLAVSFLPVFQKLAIQWDTGDNSYCYLIVPLFLYLCWEKKDSFKFGEFSWNVWGLVPILLSILLMFAGELGSVETLLYLGIWGCIAGAFFMFYGLRVRHLLFPLLILIFIVPLPPFINRMLTFKLKMAASTLSVKMLQAVGVSVLQEGNVIDLGVDKLQVVDACSGLRYIMPMFLMALLVGHFFSKGGWRKTLLVLLVFPLSILINGFRIFFTGLLTVNGHKELAENFFHDLAGLVIFLIAGAFLVAIAMGLKRVGSMPRQSPRRDPGAGSATSSRAAILTVLLCLLFAGSGWALRKMPEANIIPPRASFESFPMEIEGWNGKRNYLPAEILEQLWSDDYVDATFMKDGVANQIFLLIPYYEYQSTRHTGHAPQSCLLGGGWALLKSKKRSVRVGPRQEIPVMTMILKKGNHKMLGSYFFLQRGRVITSPWMNKFYLMVDAFTKRRTDGALVRVEMMVPPGQEIDDAYPELEKFLAALWQVLPQYVPN